MKLGKTQFTPEMGQIEPQVLLCERYLKSLCYYSCVLISNDRNYPKIMADVIINLSLKIFLVLMCVNVKKKAWSNSSLILKFLLVRALNEKKKKTKQKHKKTKSCHNMHRKDHLLKPNSSILVKCIIFNFGEWRDFNSAKPVMSGSSCAQTHKTEFSLAPDYSTTASLSVTWNHRWRRSAFMASAWFQQGAVTCHNPLQNYEGTAVIRESYFVR